jgi:hypothetical protein
MEEPFCLYDFFTHDNTLRGMNKKIVQAKRLQYARLHITKHYVK